MRDNITLYNGDCLEIIPQLVQQGIKVDMILCDLPYGVTNHPEDKSLPFDKLWECYDAIISDNGVIVLFAQGQFYVDLVNSNRKLFKYDLIWDKQLTTGFLNANRMPLRRHESIAVFYKKAPVYNPQKSIGKPNHDKGKKHKLCEPTNQNYGAYKPVDTELSELKHPTSIVSFQKPHPSACLHRTQKPVSLLEYLIKTYTHEGMTVLDNCMGSGSTGAACQSAARNFIGIEKYSDCFEVAKKRLLSYKKIDRSRLLQVKVKQK